MEEPWYRTARGSFKGGVVWLGSAWLQQGWGVGGGGGLSYAPYICAPVNAGFAQTSKQPTDAWNT